MRLARHRGLIHLTFVPPSGGHDIPHDSQMMPVVNPQELDRLVPVDNAEDMVLEPGRQEGC